MKKIPSLFILLILAWASSSFAQVEINAAKEYTPAEIDAVYKTGSGISGPGQAG